MMFLTCMEEREYFNWTLQGRKDTFKEREVSKALCAWRVGGSEGLWFVCWFVFNADSGVLFQTQG